MAEFCDLHTHSHYSDGTCSPEEILRLSAARSLSAVALTDHNTLEGLPEFTAAASGYPVQAIPGVEISTGYLGKELHIVGLFLPREDWDAVSDFLSIINLRKEESNRALVRRLTRGGFSLDYDAIRSSHPEGTVNRAVIAAELVRKKYVPSVAAAFQTLLKPEQGYFVPPERICAFEAISFLRVHGGVPVLAHPFLNLTEKQLRQFLPDAKSQGLVGMETLYAAYPPEVTARSRGIAREFGLKESGGSDFHGQNKPDISLGWGHGDLGVPLSFARTLQNKEG